ncbi:camphor resistance protein CrcB [Aurantimicrobium sp. INA4]|uniref:fluoride efflux transporter CrcB n=1 Tax=Aurantimicrobium sp. INA4 TaxID=2986279 RepID=UPI0024934BBA|nr:fluoride efflux transporter CrcB [Aurantimicrobium sp. INA4]BDU11509.1 camphor resistance protein CrcB [Aurantimicrobium sp. INA4]
MNALSFILAIVAGGIGAGLRYGATVVLPPKKEGFPLAIFIINVVGSFLIGIFTALLINTVLSTELGFILVAGFCGGFTTMSTFAVESVERMQSGKWFIAGLNIVGSTAAGLLAVGAGYVIAGGPLSS